MKSFQLFLYISLIFFSSLAQANLSVTDYQKDDKEFIVVCKTKDTKQTYNILFLFPYPDAVHFVVGNSKEHPKDNVRKKYSFSVKDAGNSIVLSGKSIRVKIGKKDMKVAINRPFESYFFQGFLQLNSHPEYDRRVIVLNHAIKPEERFFGFGERLSGFNQRGNRFVMELGDCWCESCTNAYKSIPFYYSSRSYALLINSHQRYIFDIGKPELRIT